MKRTLLAAALATASFTGSAASYSESDVFPVGFSANLDPLNWGTALLALPFTPDGSVQLSIPKFNTGLGTLTGVSYQLDIVGEAALTASSGPAGGTANVRATITVRVPFFNDVFLEAHIPGPNQAATIAFNLPANSTQTSAIFQDTDSDTGNGLLLAPAAFWSGAGNNDFDASSYAEVTTSGTSGSLTAGILDGVSGVELTVTYTYDPPPGDVPEPGTYVAAFGFLGVAMLGYRRMRKA